MRTNGASAVTAGTGQDSGQSSNVKRVTQQLYSQEDRKQVSTQNFYMNAFGSTVNKSNGGNDPSASPEERIKKVSVLSTRGVLFSHKGPKR